MRCGTTRRGRGFRDTVSQTAPFRKPHPTIQANSGMQFPDGGSWGNCIPLRNAKTRWAFRLRSLAETASRNRRSDWDVFSRSSPSGKLRPGICARNGTWFPRGPKQPPVPRQNHPLSSVVCGTSKECPRVPAIGTSPAAGSISPQTRAGNRSHLRGFSGRSQRYVTEAHVSYGLPNGTGTRCLSRLTKR